VFRCWPSTVVIMDKRGSKDITGGIENTGRSLPSGNDSTDAEDQFQLGFRCASRPGTLQDYAEAAEWYARAAEQNHPLAQFNLGVMYANGQGVQQDDVKASQWFDRAAHRGDAGAQYRLGMTHYRHSLTAAQEKAPESRIEACKWFVLAAAHGYGDSEEARHQVTLKMSREEVVEATLRVSNFMISLRQNCGTQPSLQ
jgi:TPR repeat protein